MPVGLKLSLTGPLSPRDSGVLNHFQLSLSMGFNRSGRSKFAYQILADFSAEL